LLLLAPAGPSWRGFLSFWRKDPPTQAEAQALRDKCEELADDLRALLALVHALRGALVTVGVVKGGVLEATRPMTGGAHRGAAG